MAKICASRYKDHCSAFIKYIAVEPSDDLFGLSKRLAQVALRVSRGYCCVVQIKSAPRAR